MKNEVVEETQIPFEFMYVYAPIDSWEGCSDFVLSDGYGCTHTTISWRKTVACQRFIYNKVYEYEKELPHTIKFFALPNYDNYCMELCAIAKQSNNGTTFLFANDISYLLFLQNRGGGKIVAFEKGEST